MPGVEECSMVQQYTLKKILEEAIKKEELSQSLYIGLRQRVKNQNTRDAFQFLAEQEAKHRSLLEDYLQGKIKEGALSEGLVVDYKIAEHLEQPEISPTMDIKDVFLLAANKEKSTHQLYICLSEIHPAGHVKHLLEELAAQELEHKTLIETLYTEVAFPQTGGG
jgi:rubrerythrin